MERGDRGEAAGGKEPRDCTHLHSPTHADVVLSKYNHSIVCCLLYICTVWEPASAGPISCLESPNTLVPLLHCLPSVSLTLVVHPFGQLKNLGPFITDKKTRVLLLISKTSWQEDILEILKVTVIRTSGVKTQLLLKTGTQT